MKPLKKTLAAVPVEWTDAKDIEMPAGSLEKLERQGLIEVRQHGSPPRVQVRQKEQPTKPAA